MQCPPALRVIMLGYHLARTPTSALLMIAWKALVSGLADVARTAAALHAVLRAFRR